MVSLIDSGQVEILELDICYVNDLPVALKGAIPLYIFGAEFGAKF